MKKVAVSWSGGKDSALAYHRVRQTDELEIEEIFTNFSSNGRVSIHGLRKEIIDLQEEMLDVQITRNQLPEDLSMEEFQKLMIDYYNQLEQKGIEAVVFADIFESEARKNREKIIEKTDIEGIWPLWDEETLELAQEMIEKGIKAKIISAEEGISDRVLGREIDERILKILEEEKVDFCGEKGEFHTVVTDAPEFNQSLEIEELNTVSMKPKGKKYVYQDLEPVPKQN